MKKKKKRGIKWALSVMLGFACALVLGLLFYGTMVYQLTGEDGARAHTAAETVPLEQGKSAQELFPGPMLSLPGTLAQERAQDVEFGGETCRVITRTYTLPDGSQATAVSATPAAYFGRLSQEGWTPQLITGFTLAGLDAVFERREQQGMLIARDGAYVYALEAAADEQALYALGAGASLK